MQASGSLRVCYAMGQLSSSRSERDAPLPSQVRLPATSFFFFCLLLVPLVLFICLLLFVTMFFFFFSAFPLFVFIRELAVLVCLLESHLFC